MRFCFLVGIIVITMSQKQKSNRARTYARNRATATALKNQVVESDSKYFLKLVIVMLLGVFWVKFANPLSLNGFMIGGIPLGCIVGLVGIHLLEKNQFDRKIWYAMIIIVAIVSNFFPTGIIL